MQRRRFLGGLAVGSGAVLAGLPLLSTTTSGCGGAALPPSMTRAETDALVARLERGLGAVRSHPQGAIAAELRGHPQPEAAEALMRLGLEAFVVADVVRSVPSGARMSRELSARLAPELPVVDRYTQTFHALLSGMKAPARRRLDAQLRAMPDAGMGAAAWIDGHAGKLGVAGESRFKLRAAALDATVRMRRQSSAAVIDDCVAKVEAVAERHGETLSLARSIVSAAMIDAIWQQVENGVAPPPGPPAGPTGAPPPDGLAAPPPASQAVPPPPPPQYVTAPGGVAYAAPQMADDRGQWNARWARPGDEEIEYGAIMMPFGLLTCGLLLIIGLIVVIAGCVQNSDWNGETEATRNRRERGGY